MKYSIAVAAALAAHASAHGAVTKITGANGAVMAGVGIQDGIVRDTGNPLTAEGDTSIIRDRDISSGGSPLGRTKAGDNNAADTITAYMSGSGPNKTKSKRALADILGGLGGGAAGGAGGAASASGTKTPKGTKENIVGQTAGTGAQMGLPTAADDGTVTMTFHQVNQDGAGPLTAQIDATSAGTDQSAFQDAQVTQDVPGFGFMGLSQNSAMDFDIKVQMPQGMVCSGSAGGASNVCVVKVQNSAIAGPFGGSAVFTQTAAQRKRAVEYNLRKRELEQ